MYIVSNVFSVDLFTYFSGL